MPVMMLGILDLCRYVVTAACIVQPYTLLQNIQPVSHAAAPHHPPASSATGWNDSNTVA